MRRLREIVYRLPAWLLSIVVVVLICYLTLVPRPLPDEAMVDVPGIDKVVHAIMFGAVVMSLAVDYARRARPARPLTQGALVAFLAISIAFGGAIELLQNVMGLGRGAELLDFIADTTGALVAYVWAPRFVRWLLG